MWQKFFEEHGNRNFTVVGLALDAEGIEPAARYYRKYGVTFPALVDPAYATRFGAVPKTFFIDEHGVVRDIRNWKQQLPSADEVFDVPASVRAQWSTETHDPESPVPAELVDRCRRQPNDLRAATELARRYLSLGLTAEARAVLERVVEFYDPLKVARAGGQTSVDLGRAWFQLMRCFADDRERQIKAATMSYYLNPSIGFAKQIARLIDPDRFDATPDGRLDNAFREATYQRLKRERAEWLRAEN